MDEDAPVPVIVITLGDEVVIVIFAPAAIEVVELESPLIAVIPLPVFVGTQKLPFHVRTWFVDGAVDETALP